MIHQRFLGEKKHPVNPDIPHLDPPNTGDVQPAGAGIPGPSDAGGALRSSFADEFPQLVDGRPFLHTLLCRFWEAFVQL